jgi:hypothetical protein
MIKDYIIKPITSHDCKEWLLKKHYLRRMVSISFAFGLFDKNQLKGVLTFGNAVPLTMKKSLFGAEYMHLVYELNRLCIEEGMEKNAGSYFISNAFKLLPKPLVIVSYADKSFGHNGFVYQASNFLFTGESHSQLDWKLKGQEDKHSRTLMDEFAFEKDRINKLKEKYGDLLYQVQRPPKYRYVYVLGSNSFKNKIMKSKLFNVMPYPKGDNKRYDASYVPVVQPILF